MQRLVAAIVFTVVSQVSIGDEAEDAQRVCTVIESMGAAVECQIDGSERAVDVTSNENVADAPQFCASFSGIAAALTQTLSSGWKMRIFTPQSGATPAAVCDLS